MTEKEEAKQAIIDILQGQDLGANKALFLFNRGTNPIEILKKFDIWARFFLPHYFQKKGVEPPEYYDDAAFHRKIDEYDLKAYLEQFTFVDIAFRGGAKTARTKMFLAFAIANDESHYRRYIKILSADIVNARQIVTDIYNIFVRPEVAQLYPEIFEKTNAKREETMASFTTATGVKILADTVGVSQRGALQDDSRPDLILFEDFEDRSTLRSAVKTHTIWENMEEARTSLAINGSCIYNCNYVSEAGNVHKLVTKKMNKKEVLIVPIITDDKVIAWPCRYTMADIEQMRQSDEDFEGERLCKPSISKEVYFAREKIEKQKTKNPVRNSNGFKIYSEYNPSHEYAGGMDVAGGVGLDSSASVFMDFTCYPAEVVACYSSNTISPEVFGYEIQRQSEIFGNCLVCPERNYGDSTILVLKQLGVTMYEFSANYAKIDGDKQATEYGWKTNTLTKHKILSELRNALNDGLLIINDADLLNEIRSYTRNDSMDRAIDPRLTTRHFDLLIACAIAWQMREHRLPSNHKLIKQQKQNIKHRREYVPLTKYGG